MGGICIHSITWENNYCLVWELIYKHCSDSYFTSYYFLFSIDVILLTDPFYLIISAYIFYIFYYELPIAYVFCFFDSWYWYTIFLRFSKSQESKFTWLPLLSKRYYWKSSGSYPLSIIYWTRNFCFFSLFYYIMVDNKNDNYHSIQIIITKIVMLNLLINIMWNLILK